jgi:ABC-type multidrug transport system fused ATPase/permease subunit
VPLLAQLGDLKPSTGTTWLDVLVNIIIGVFALAVVTIPSLLVVRRTRKAEEHAQSAAQTAEKVTSTLGESNGKGTIVQMLEHQVTWAERHDARDDERFGRIEQRQTIAAIVAVAVAVIAIRRT